MGFLSDAIDKTKAGIPDTGQFMSGGFFSKAIDLLSTTNYMSAGAVDAALRGDNPLTGAVEGLQTRRSFTDVLGDRGVPPAVATPLGIVGDIVLDPATWATGGLALSGKARHLGRIKELIERMPAGLRTAKEVAAGVGDLGKVDDAASMAELVRFGRSKYAHEAYKKAEPSGLVAAKRAARAAAKNYDPSEAELVALGEEVLASTRFGPISASQAGGWKRGLDFLKKRLVYSMEDFVRKDLPNFGRVGGSFVRQAKMQEAISQGLNAETLRLGNEVIRLVGRKKENWIRFTKAVHGLEPMEELSPELQKAWKLWDELRNVRFDDLREAGVKQVHTVLSVLFGRKMPEVQQAILKKLGEGQVDQLAKFEPGSVDWFAQQVQKFGGEITADGAVHMPIQKHANYGPLYAKGEMIKRRATQMDFQDMVRQFMEAEPGLSLEKARVLAEDRAMEIFMAPNDIRKQFQYGRLSQHIPIDEKLMELDPAIWVSKWSRDVSDRIAQAMAWGGDDEIFKEMKQTLKLQGDMVPGFKGDEQLQHVFDLMTGQFRHPLKPMVSAVSQAANLFFLGPRTAIVQATQLANNASWTGVSNALAGIASAMTDPLMRKLNVRLGVALPTLQHAADADALSKVTGVWHKIIGVEYADKMVRTAGAIGSALHGLETADNLVAAARSGNKAAMAKYVRIMELHGVDAQKVLERGGQMIDDELTAFMLRGANATNFTNSVMSLPSVFREPGGQFFLKFKTYAAQQSGFIYKLMTRAKNGDWGPLLRYAAVFPWIYGMTFRAMNELRTKPIDTEDDWSMLQNMMLTGAFGFWGDAAMALGSPSEAMRLGIVGGANVSMLTKATGGVAATIRGEADFSEPWKTVATGRQLHALITGEQE